MARNWQSTKLGTIIMEALQRLHNRGSISTGYDIDNSLKFEADNTEYLSFSNSVGENRRTWTYSTWVKKTEVGFSGVGGTLFGAYLSGSDRARIEQYADQLGLHGKISGTTAVNVRTTRILRDSSAWYHCMVVLDTTQATETDRVKIYVNGVQETSMTATTYPPQNYQFAINNAVNHYVGQKGDGTDYFSGYMAETYFIDGQALTPTSFGETDSITGIWKPKEFSGTYPSADTNHFYLNFDDSSNLGKDSSGNGKNMTSNNITAADQATDTPTNNFCTMNMLNRTDGNSKTQEGGTKVTTDGGSGWCSMIATMGVTKGKWYWETQRSGGSSDSNDVVVGIAGSEDIYIPHNTAAKYYIGNVAETSSMGFYTTGVPNVRNGSGDSISNSAGDIIMVGLDLDNSKLYFGVNGTWDGLGTGGSTIWSSFDDQFVMPAVAVYQGKQIKINFGGYASYTISSANSDADGYGTFEYAVPSGYYALCTKNLEEYG